MRIIPAIDLIAGNCVRLLRGDFEQQTEYSRDPVTIAAQFGELAVADLHIVDLDGALHGSPRNARVVEQIVAANALEVQLGGGIRSYEALKYWFERGVARCVIGSIAVRSPATVLEWAREFGAERLVIALDVRIDDGTPILATDGWTENSGKILWDYIEIYFKAGICNVLCTDIYRDGAMSGPNIGLYETILQRYPGLQLQASGGVRNSADLASLRAAGLPATITGRALLDGAISRDEVASFQASA
jgi:phosphoribosylformimino-5-aminoimidazole carboxamide ribotide isomerase